MPAYVIFDVEIQDMPQYQALTPVRDACSFARLVSVEGLPA